MSSGGSGANAYWPGFVDALTNVVIAMIFVVVVLAISLSFAAQMMGKKLAEKLIEEHKAKTAQAVPGTPPAPPQLPVNESALPKATRIAVAGNEAPASAPSAAVRQVRNTLQLDYAPSAITLDTAAAESFKAAVAALGGSLAQRRVQIVAGGPGMAISDNQRSAYLRVMSVRNTLLEMGMPTDRIEVRIDTELDLPAPRLNISFSNP